MTPVPPRRTAARLHEALQELQRCTAQLERMNARTLANANVRTAREEHNRAVDAYEDAVIASVTARVL